ncbi:TCP-1/cpn60 chaperonin family protein [Candidatus Woesearchaeota archaeon]|nr:TCP-1/cpn60 chaperonin family protein [Candidatus Woesearchaeota archaeon]
MSTNQVQPIFILPEDTKRTTGREAQQNNIAAAKAVAQAVRTTLGPKGMDKMIVDSVGDVTVTNDGVTILREMHVEHPAAKMVVEIAKTQEDSVGDGTTTAVVIAGELLKKAEELLEQNIHPTVLAKGYHLAEKEAQRILQKIAKPISIHDVEMLRQIAATAMTGKGAEASKENLADILVTAVTRVLDVKTSSKIDLECIKVERVIGESAEKSELIEGIVLDRERVHPAMPVRVEQARIALLDAALEIKNTEIDAKIQITDPMQLTAFLDQEERTLREMVRAITASGATVVFCQRGIDDLAQHFLAKAGVIAARRVKKSDMEKLAKATGGKIISSWKELSPADLGFAGVVREEKVGEEKMIFVEKCTNPKAVTLLVRGGTEHVADEVKRAVTDALGDLGAAIRDGFVVAGAGSTEMEVARGLRHYARTLSGREQLAVQAFAETLEVIPRTLAENAGLDPIDILTKLRSAHDQQQTWAGVDVFSGNVMDAWVSGVLEPLKIKTLALKSATEVAEMILRIDDVIMGGGNKRAPIPSPGAGLE